jgi:hypothetical protein
LRSIGLDVEDLDTIQLTDFCGVNIMPEMHNSPVAPSSPLLRDDKSLALVINK